MSDSHISGAYAAMQATLDIRRDHSNVIRNLGYGMIYTEHTFSEDVFQENSFSVMYLV
jgi:hypothetical protein